LSFPFRALPADEKPDTNAVWLAEHYTKYEHRIPMRDGVRLFTRVYVPKDDSQPWPIILTRTPYALKPYGSDNYNDPVGSFRTLARDRFILVMQDVRGRYGSEGEYMHVRPFHPNKGPKDTDESSDTWDTIDWLVKNVPNNSGKAGLFGISYPGFYTSMGMIDSHPALKAATAGAHCGLVHGRRHPSQRRVLSLAELQFFYVFAQRAEDRCTKT
jgi:predicted acyl esterase